MAVDKLVDSTQLDNDLTAVANAIRSKRGISNVLLFPSEFVTEINNISSIEKKSGSVVNFSAAEIYTIPQVEIDIDPVQDLHGYNNPWPAGGGKNLAGFTIAQMKQANNTGTWTGDVYTWQGITFTPEIVDGYCVSIKVTGTATGQANFVCRPTSDPFVLTAGNTFMISGCPANGSVDSYGLYATSQGITDYGNGIYFVASSSDTYVGRIRIANGYSCPTDGLVFKVQIEAGSTKTTFAPYSNICPISGWTGCNISQSGADTSNPTIIPISWQTEAGTVYGGTLDLTTMVLTVNRVLVDLGTLTWARTNTTTKWEFTTRISDLKAVAANQVGNLICSNYKAVTANQTWAGSIIGISCFRASTFNELEVFDDAYSTAVAFKAAMSGVQLVYELETPQTYQLTPEQLSVNYYKQTWTGASGESIQLYDTQARNAFILMTRYTKAETHSATDGLLTNYTTSNIYVSNTTQGTSADDNNITIKSTSYDSNYIYLFAPPSVIADVAALRAYLANTPLEIQYPVETPFNYELYEKDHINTLIGVNNIWANTGDMHITVIGGL